MDDPFLSVRIVKLEGTIGVEVIVGITISVGIITEEDGEIITIEVETVVL